MQNRLVYGFVFLVSLVFLIGFSSALTYVDSCRTLNQSGETYILNQSVTVSNAGETCLTITADNIVLNGNGYYIYGPDSFESGGNVIMGNLSVGVSGNGLNNVTIRNLGVYNFSMYGIYLYSVNRSRIENVALSAVTGFSSYSALVGLQIGKGFNNSVDHLISEGTFEISPFRIWQSSTYNIVSNVSSSILVRLSNYNTFYNISSISVHLASFNTIDSINGPITVSGTNNVFRHIDNIALGEDEDTAITVLDSNNIFIDGILNAITYISGGNTTFVNMTTSDPSFESVDGGQLIRKWYLDVNVTNSLGQGVQSINVSGYNNSNSLQFSALTGSNGNVARQEVIEYINNGGTRTYYSNYSINATSSLWADNSTSVNITGNTNVNFVLPGIDSCGTLDQAGMSYKLVNNISFNGLCFYLVANNIVLDGNGQTLNKSKITTVSSQNNISVKNLIMLGDLDGTGILFNTISNSSISNSVFSSLSTGIAISNSINILMSNLNINSNGYGVDFYSSSLIINNSAFYDNHAFDLIDFSGGSTVEVINSTYSLEKEAISNDDILIRKWYLDVNVKDQTNNNLINVNVTGRNNSNSLQFSTLTNSNGAITRQEVIEYINNGGTRTYYGLYNISASKTNYTTNSTIVNITANKVVNLILKNILPSAPQNWTVNNFVYPNNASAILPDNQGYIVVEIPRPSNLNSNPITQFTFKSSGAQQTKNFELYFFTSKIFSKSGNLGTESFDVKDRVNILLKNYGNTVCTSTHCYIVFKEKYSGSKPVNYNLVVKGSH